MKIRFPLSLKIGLVWTIIFTCSCDTPTSNNSNSSRKVVKLGAIIPLTGAVSDIGDSFRKGLNLAIANIPTNSKFDYKLIIEDDQLEASKVATSANKLLFQDKVDAIISTWSYGGNVVAPMLKSKPIPHFAIAWDPHILNYGTNNFLHLLSPKDFLPDFFRIFKAKSYTKLALVYFTEAGSEYCATEFKKLAKENNMEVVSEHNVLTNEDFYTLALKIKNSKAEIVFTNLVAFQTESLIKKLKELKYPGEITSMTGFDQISDLSIANGNWYISDSTPTTLNVTDRVTYGLGNYYDFVKIIVEAYEAWDGNDLPESKWIINYINQKDSFESAFGPLTFKDRTAVYRPKYYKVTDGEKKEVEIDDLK